MSIFFSSFNSRNDQLGGHRSLRQLDHEVRLLAPRSVRPFVLRNKTDAADAQAIWTAVQQPGACTAAIKHPDQQAILSLHRLRAQLLNFLIMQSNALRGLFYEFGIVLPEGYATLVKDMPDAFVQAENQVPELLLESLREQWQRVLRLPYTSAHLEGAQSEKIIPSWHSVQETPEAILEIRRILHQHLLEKNAT